MAEILRQGSAYHLRGDSVSYIIGVLPGGVAAHLYFGPRVEEAQAGPLLRHFGVDAERFTVQNCALDRLPQEYPAFGLGDQREGALAVDGPQGAETADLRFRSAQIIRGKPALSGLPFPEHRNFMERMQTLADKGCIVVISTQVAMEGSDLATYEVGHEAMERYDLLQAYDMTTEAAVTKLMWLLGLDLPREEFKKAFYTPVAFDTVPFSVLK